jgi:thiol-disulfide isomerase/thioredoxin
MGTFSGLISLFCILSFSMINIGDMAPAFINETQWLRGKAPDLGKEIIIIELWSSSCSACRGEIKHLTDLQKFYGDRIHIVGLNSDPIDILKNFIDVHNDEIGYTVGHVSKEFMSKYSVGVVPSSFIIDKKGDVVWKGHPAIIEEVLNKILAGETDIEFFKKLETMEKVLDDKIKSNDMTSMAKAARAILDIDPSNVQSLKVVISYAKYNKVPKLIREIFDSIPMTDLNGYKANLFAIMLLYDSDLGYRYPEAAIKYATYALKQWPENGDYINTYARSLYCLGDVEKAIVWQKKAVNLVPDNSYYQDNLDYYLSIKLLRDNN